MRLITPFPSSALQPLEASTYGINGLFSRTTKAGLMDSLAARFRAVPSSESYRPVRFWPPVLDHSSAQLQRQSWTTMGSGIMWASSGNAVATCLSRTHKHTHPQYIYIYSTILNPTRNSRNHTTAIEPYTDEGHELPPVFQGR